MNLFYCFFPHPMNGTFIDKQFIVALKQRMRSSAQEPSPCFITTNNSNHWSKCGRFYLLWWAFKNENLTSPLLGASHLREARAVALDTWGPLNSAETIVSSVAHSQPIMCLWQTLGLGGICWLISRISPNIPVFWLQKDKYAMVILLFWRFDLSN